MRTPRVLARSMYSKIPSVLACLVALSLFPSSAETRTWCWREGLTNVFEAEAGGACPSGNYQVELCDVEYGTGRLRIVPFGNSCPPRQVRQESQTPTDLKGWAKWKNKVDKEGLPLVVLTTETGSAVNTGPLPTSTDEPVQPGVIKGFVPNHEIDLTGVSAEDSRISRHFGKFVGTLGALAVLAAAFALLRVARRRVQPLIAAKVSELRQAETPPAQDEHFIRALDELDNGTMDRAMWARSMAATGGDNQKARADYISRRSTQLAAT